MPDPIPDAYGKLRPMYAFVMVLGYSRMLTVVFSFRRRLVDFLRCHAQALAFFGGTPRTIVYDNLKSVVLSRRGAEVTFNPAFLPFADHYGFKPLPTWPGEPHEKGLVERPIQYLGTNFWAGRNFTSLEDVEGQGSCWRDDRCNVRIHNGLDERPIDGFEIERSHLRALPAEPYQAEEPAPRPLAEILFAKATRWGYVRLDSNDYSIPLLSWPVRPGRAGWQSPGRQAGCRLGAHL